VADFESEWSGRSEQELVDTARRSDEQAFREIVRRLEGRVAATVIGMLGPGPEADDVGQETFVRLYRALPKFRGDSTLASYVTRIAINLCRNEWQRRKRRSDIFVRDESDQSDNVPGPAGDADSLPERDLIRRALLQLAAEYREVIVLRLMDGFSTREAAGILDVPEGTVTSRLARGQMKLRAILEPMLKEAS
jgi:RNA polymerase sigma-70 factor (ECF subfamily)